MLNPRSVADLRQNVFDQFPRTAAKIVAIFDRQNETWISELSRAYHFHFLRLYPVEHSSFTFPLNLATAPRKRHEWIAPGWLVTTADQGAYRMSYPFELEEWEDSDWWGDTRVSKLWYVKRFDEDGKFVEDLPVLSRNMAFSRAFSKETQCPRFCYLTSTEQGSYLNFYPVPDERYLYAVEFQEVDPRHYEIGDGQFYNRFLNGSPRIVEVYCLIRLCNFFDEPAVRKTLEEELYGVPSRGLKQAINNKTGLIGDIIRQGIFEASQQSQSLPWFGSAKKAVGRSGIGRSPRYPNRWGYS